MPTDGTLFLENLPRSKQYLLTFLSIFFSLGAVLSSIISYFFLPGRSCRQFDGCDIAGAENDGWRRVLLVLGSVVCKRGAISGGLVLTGTESHLRLRSLGALPPSRVAPVSRIHWSSAGGLIGFEAHCPIQRAVVRHSTCRRTGHRPYRGGYCRRCLSFGARFQGMATGREESSTAILRYWRRCSGHIASEFRESVRFRGCWIAPTSSEVAFAFRVGIGHRSGSYRGGGYLRNILPGRRWYRSGLRRRAGWSDENFR